MKLLCSFLALLAIPTATLAQERPPLPDRHDTLTVRYGDAVIGHGVKIWTHHHDEFLVVYVWTSALDGSSVTDSLFADPITLQPRREVRLYADTTLIVDFDASPRRVRRIVRGVELSTPMHADSIGRYSSASIESLAATIQLVPGNSETFETYYAPPSRIGTRTTTIRVESLEMLEGHRAWRVSADTPGGGTTFWIDEATRTVLQSDTREGDALITFRR